MSYEPPRGTTTSQGQFKLISVSFKEAALDSPSFRACINHTDTQIDNIDKWIQALVSAIKKIPRYIREFQSFYNSFLEHLVPAFLQDGLIDQEYTLQALHAILKGLTSFRDVSVNSLSVHSYVIDNLSIIVSKHIAHYREVRAAFERCQEKHDRYLALYVSTPKTKEAVSVIEDAQQLHSVRKEYIKVSLDIVTEVLQLSNILDKTLVSLASDLWKRKRGLFLPGAKSELYDEIWSKLRRIQAWSDSYAGAIAKLANDHQQARVQVEEATIAQFAPSLDPSSYRAAAINAHSLADIDERSNEKHGYVFMKSFVDGKTVWVRRWAFLKSGVFGMLVLSPSGMFVQETDKIGILLCNVRYSANEERRFCFEVKSSDFTAVLQAETLIELKSWLKVFDNERQRVLSNMTSDPDSFNVASGRYPPIISELASTASTSVDHLLTNTRIVHSSGHIITSSKLGEHIESHKEIFHSHIYNHLPLAKSPCVTNSTKSAIISYSIVSPTSVPTALTANIWGSVNWGVYYLHDTIADWGDPSAVDPNVRGQPDMDLIIAQQKFSEKEQGVYYPEYYPKELIPVDIQMRALFDSAIEPGDYCIMSFRCIWSPNSRQELSGRCFFTRNHIYFSMHASGFSSLFKGYVGTFLQAEVSPQKDHDVLKLYTVKGMIRTKLYLDDCRLVADKANLLIKTRNAEPRLSLKDVLEQIQAAERAANCDHEMVKAIERLGETTNDLQSIIAKYNPKRISAPPLKEVLSGLSTVQTLLDPEKAPSFEKVPSFMKSAEFPDNYTLFAESLFSAPPKAVFHALMGQHGVLLKDHAYRRSKFNISAPWSKSGGVLKRTLLCPIQILNLQSTVLVSQTIDEMEDNVYYSFTNRRESFQLSVGAPFLFEYRFVLVRTSKDHTRLYAYCKTIFTHKSVFNGFIDNVAMWIASGHIRSLQKRLEHAVHEMGTHGQVAKSIYLHGKLLEDTSAPDDKKAVSDTILKGHITHVSFFMVFRIQVNRYSFTVVNYLIRFMRMLVYLCLNTIKSISLQWVLLLVIAVLGVMNIFLAGKTTISYWTVHRANSVATYVAKREPTMLQRAVYLKDVQEKVHESSFKSLNRTGRALGVFQNQSFVFNRLETVDFNSVYGDKETRRVARSLHSQHKDIGVRRHELMVQLKMLDGLEFEIAQAEWANWLMSEINRCQYIKGVLLGEIGDVEGKIQKGADYLIDYCRECTAELKNLDV